MYCGNSKIKKRVVFILAAAGIGKRMNLDYPKQFLEFKGEPLFYSSLQKAYKNDIIDEIIIVTNENNMSYVENFCKNKKMESKVKVIAGGAERQHSIFNAIKKIKNADYVIIQDGVRPFLKERYFYEILSELEKGYDGAIIATKSKDTIKIINENKEVIETPNRNFTVSVQTPQAFKFENLKLAHIEAEKNDFLGTDDASLIEKINGRVKIVYGDYDNIKVTVQEDLKFLEINQK